MDKLRRQINQIDEKLMALIDERYQVTKAIGEFKRKNNIAVTNSKREEEVLSKADIYLYGDEIKDVYKMMFKKNKYYQGFEYGLIGKYLPYTLSPMIYELMGLSSYEVIETDDFKKTISKLNFKGLNITIPYKSEAYEFCDELDDSAKLTKSVNTIYNNVGYNTDFLALVDLFTKLEIKDGIVTIIGNGATSRATANALKKVSDHKINYLVRTKRDDNELLLSQYEDLLDSEYIINTTPYGTYPNVEDKPLFPLAKFKKLKMVIDVIYNPLNTPLILEAKKYNIKSINGLDLLVRQANLNFNLFTGCVNNNTSEVLNKIKGQLYNIVLIGLSYSGKTTLGKSLAEKLNKNFIDTDGELAKDYHDLASLINDHPISVFRQYELEMAKKIGLTFNNVIATGGGMVLSPETMQYLSYNSIIIHLDTPLEVIKMRYDDSRPLLKSINDLEVMYQERDNLYKKYRMIAIDDKTSVDEVMEKIYAYFSN